MFKGILATIFVLFIYTTNAQIISAKADISTTNSVVFTNNTSESIYLAIAYMGYADGIMDVCIVTEGWHVLAPQEKFNPNTGEVLYYYAIDNDKVPITSGSEEYYVDLATDFTVSELTMRPEEHFAGKTKVGFTAVNRVNSIIFE